MTEDEKANLPAGARWVTSVCKLEFWLWVLLSLASGCRMLRSFAVLKILLLLRGRYGRNSNFITSTFSKCKMFNFSCQKNWYAIGGDFIVRFFVWGLSSLTLVFLAEKLAEKIVSVTKPAAGFESWCRPSSGWRFQTSSLEATGSGQWMKGRKILWKKDDYHEWNGIKKNLLQWGLKSRAVVYRAVEERPWQQINLSF